MAESISPQPVSPHSKWSRAVEEGWKKQVGRVIAHVDLDAFYTQVEVKNNPARLQGKPVAVMQYNPFGDLASHAPSDDRIFNDSNGSLIAVSYEARKFGVKRNMRGDEARKACPDLISVQVPTAHGKADLTHYRSAGKQVTDILARLSICEKASIDECYLDITKEAKRRLAAAPGPPPAPVNPHESHICGHENSSAVEWYGREEGECLEDEKLLACGAAAVSDLRAAVKSELGFSCSAGIAHCKILAKLASGMHKPSQQTLVPAGSVPGLLRELPIPKLRQLGGKLGEEVMTALNVKTVGELAAVPKSKLAGSFSDSQACWLHELAHGIDADEVKQRTLPKSIGCGKTFHGKHTLTRTEDVRQWIRELAEELEDRVKTDHEENSREPKLVTVHASSAAVSYHGSAISRSGPLRKPTADAITEDAMNLLKKWTSVTAKWSITGLSLTVSNFVAAPRGKSTLTRFFKQEAAPKKPAEEPGNMQLPAVAPKGTTVSKNWDHQSSAIQRQSEGPTNLDHEVSAPTENRRDCQGTGSRAQAGSEPARVGFPWEAQVPVTAPGATINESKIQKRQNDAQTPESSEQEAGKQTSGVKVPASKQADSEHEPKKRRLHEDEEKHVPSAVLSESTREPESNAQKDNGSKQQAVEQGSSSGTKSINGVDAEVWDSLPPEIQRELRLASMAALRKPGHTKETSNIVTKSQHKKAGPIANFFAKKS